MNKLSLNIKKIALSLLVVGLAIGTQSYKSAEKNIKGKFAEKVYYRLGANYVFPEPEGTCETLDNTSCTVTFTGDEVPTVTSFPVGDIPSGDWSAESSITKGSYPE